MIGVYFELNGVVLRAGVDVHYLQSHRSATPIPAVGMALPAQSNADPTAATTLSLISRLGHRLNPAGNLWVESPFTLSK